jgi:hypothetical protein
MEYPSGGRYIVRFAFVVCFATVLGCDPASRPPSVLPPTLKVPSQQSRVAAPTTAVDCGLFPGRSESTEPITTVGLADRVDPNHAPFPTNESERLLFRQLYETLIRADCQGHASPGLASSWRFDESTKTWIVALRPNARFSDNKPVMASDVVSSWTGNGSELRPEVRRLVRSISVVDDRTLEIELENRRADSVLTLAQTDLAIATSVPGARWPIGTRPARIDAASSSEIRLSNLSGSFSLRFLAAPGSDSRDLLDRGADLLLTRDSRTLDYAATLPQFQSAPLPWLRTHVLLAPSGVRAVPAFSAEERRALAQEAIRGEARGAEGPFWWESLSDCEIDPPQSPPVPPSTTPRIVYDSDDSAARELAERLVGIGKYPRASGLTSDALAQAMRRGNESAFIVSLDRRPLDPCREIQVLMDRAGWVDPRTIVPLVDTRLQAIVRRGRAGLNMEWDGSLLLELRN